MVYGKEVEKWEGSGSKNEGGWLCELHYVRPSRLSDIVSLNVIDGVLQTLVIGEEHDESFRRPK